LSLGATAMWLDESSFAWAIAGKQQPPKTLEDSSSQYALRTLIHQRDKEWRDLKDNHCGNDHKEQTKIQQKRVTNYINIYT
jgi:hypothetical protein